MIMIWIEVQVCLHSSFNQDFRFFSTNLSIVYGSLTAIMHDAKHFTQPQIFNPNRFINEGKFVKDPRVCVFSTGLRNCVGKKLAQIELFTFAANIIHRFKLVHQEGDLVPMKHNTLLKPNDFRVQFQAR